jgi:IclR family pca regulon transcriptional regulator
MHISLGVGSRLPAYCTSLGRLLLADLEDDEVRARLEASNIEALTKHTVTDIDALMAKVAQARKQQWCLVNQELEEGLISVAAPIVNKQGQMVAALNISGQANRTSAKVMQETMLPALIDAAKQVSRLL